MDENNFLPWFGMMFPLIFSAGPANVAMASLGARFGFMKSLPFISGINLTVLAQALLIGFGAGAFLGKYPGVSRYLQYAGSLYLIYLASKFFRSSRLKAGEVAENVPHFVDGFILQMFNMKVVTVMMVMFAHFLDTDSGRLSQVAMLSVGIASMTTCATVTWAACGSWLTRTFSSEKSFRLQGYLFGGMLIGVAVWMLF